MLEIKYNLGVSSPNDIRNVQIQSQLPIPKSIMDKIVKQVIAGYESNKIKKFVAESYDDLYTFNTSLLAGYSDGKIDAKNSTALTFLDLDILVGTTSTQNDFKKFELEFLKTPHENHVRHYT